MHKKEISEIKKIISPDGCIDWIRGCYVSEEGEIIHELRDSPATMEKEEMEKYCELLRGVLSGKPGRNLYNMEFPVEEEAKGGRQQLLFRLQQSRLKNDKLVSLFFKKVVKQFRCQDKYLILLAHGIYDILDLGSDNENLKDASDRVYSYLLCCICPVTLKRPVSGFLFPALNDGRPDIHSLLYYCCKEDEPHEEFSSGLLGCVLKPMKISVKAEMEDMLKTRVIDGTEYLLIPVVDELDVNGIRILRSKDTDAS